MCRNFPNPLAFVVQYQNSNAKMKRYSCWYAFFYDFQKLSIRKNIFLFKKLIFSQPRSPALHGRLSPFRGGHAVENCKIAPWQIYHAGWQDRKGNSNVIVEKGDTLCLCNNKYEQMLFGKCSPFVFITGAKFSRGINMVIASHLLALLVL